MGFPRRLLDQLAHDCGFEEAEAAATRRITHSTGLGGVIEKPRDMSRKRSRLRRRCGQTRRTRLDEVDDTIDTGRDDGAT